jgi:hypothetical protein
MKKKQKLLMILLTFVALLCVVTFLWQFVDTLRKISFFTGPTQGTPDPLESELSNIILRYRRGEISEVNVSSITHFSWDKLRVFGAYTNYLDLDSIFVESWRNIASCSYGVGRTSTADFYSLLVFTDENEVVYCLLADANFYVFDFQLESGIARQDAVFVMNKLGELVIKKLLE